MVGPWIDRDAGMECEPDEFGQRIDPQFLHHPRAAILDRALGLCRVQRPFLDSSGHSTTFFHSIIRDQQLNYCS